MQPSQPIQAPTYRDQSSGGVGPSVSQGFTAFTAIATALTPLVSLARPRQVSSRPAIRRQPVQRTTPSVHGGGSASNLLIIGGIGLAVLVLGIMALKK